MTFDETGDGSSVTFAETASFDRCHDQGSFLPVSMERAEEKVPDDYKLKSNPDGTASLEVAIDRCDVTLGGTPLAGPVTWAAVGIELDPSDGDGRVPDQSDHGSADVLNDAYLLFMVTDSKPLADWLRKGTGLKAYYVPDIVHAYTIPELPLVPAAFDFQAPPPTPSPFTVTGTAPVQHVVPIVADVNFWQDTKTPDGRTWRVKIAFPSHRDYVARADVTVDAEDDSEMAQIIGTPDGKAKDPFPVSVLIDHYDAVKTRTVIGSDGVEERGCRGVVVSIRVPKGNVDPLVPEPFKLVEDPLEPGTVRLDIILQKCDAHIINGREFENVIFAHPNVPIEWPEKVAEPPLDKDGHLISYQLWLVTNNPDLVEYLHDRGATSRDIRLVSDLVYEEDDDGSVRFEAPPPHTPSPFTATAQLGPRPVLLPLPADIFRAVPRGAQWFDIEHDIQLGPLTDWTIEPREGSQLDVLLCTSPRAFADVRPSPATDESVSFEEPNDAFFSVHLQKADVGPVGKAECTGAT